jgi:hypothetical protein
VNALAMAKPVTALPSGEKWTFEIKGMTADYYDWHKARMDQVKKDMQETIRKYPEKEFGKPD